MFFLESSLEYSHNVIKRCVKLGDTVVDATVGNGHDTCFLAKLVGESGLVYGFDVQKTALESAKKFIPKEFECRTNFILDGHQNMDKYISVPIKAVMFNLGYLPGGDHSISTHHESTIEALKKAMLLLETGGIISVVIYHGGDTGFEERDKLLEFIRCIDSKDFAVLERRFINLPNNPPIGVFIEKHK